MTDLCPLIHSKNPGAIMMMFQLLRTSLNKDAPGVLRMHPAQEREGVMPGATHDAYYTSTPSPGVLMFLNLFSSVPQTD